MDRIACDIITGGFPCQDISNAGKRAGITGARSGLWGEMVQTIRMVRPKYTLVENVAALLHRGMGTVLGDLAEIGYDAEWDCIPAAALGAPHIRDRVFIVAHTNGCEQGWGKQPEREADQRDSNATRDGEEGNVDVAYAEHSGRERWEPSGQGTSATLPLGEKGNVDVPDASGTSTGLEEYHGRRQGREAAGTREPEVLRRTDGAASAEGVRTSSGDVPNAEKASVGHGIQQNSWTTQCRLGIHPDGLSGGLDGCGGWECGVPRVVQGQKNRVDRLRCLGNAVVPQVAEFIGRRILEAEQGRLPERE